MSGNRPTQSLFDQDCGGLEAPFAHPAVRVFNRWAQRTRRSGGPDLDPAGRADPGGDGMGAFRATGRHGRRGAEIADLKVHLPRAAPQPMPSEAKVRHG